MSGTMQFKSTSRQETPRRLVIIGNVDIPNLNASAVDFNGGGILNIDLSVYNPPFIIYPKQGEHWYVELVQQRWILSKKDKVASPGYLDQSVVPGDQVWNSQGNVIGNFSGNFSISDNNGILTTFKNPVWTNISVNPSYLSLRGTSYPAAGQVILVNNNIVFMRGLVNIFGGLTSLTTCGSIPSGFYPSCQTDFSIRTDQSNVSLIITSSGNIQFDFPGSAPTWAFLNGSWCVL